jgi:hypothetical protein
MPARWLAGLSTQRCRSIIESWLASTLGCWAKSHQGREVNTILKKLAQGVKNVLWLCTMSPTWRLTSVLDRFISSVLSPKHMPLPVISFLRKPERSGSILRSKQTHNCNTCSIMNDWLCRKSTVLIQTPRTIFATFNIPWTRFQRPRQL